MPEGVINIVPGYGEDAGNAIITHPDIDKIAFTGSTDIGKHIIRNSASTLKRVSLELGGKSPLIICKDMDLSIASEIGNFGCFFSSGQCCISSSRIFVHDSVYDKYVELAV